LRVNVFESEDVLVFVNLFGGNFAVDDSAEETVGHGNTGLRY
jgi:hypothetical protein